MNRQKQDSNNIPLGLNLGLWDRMTSWEEAVEIARLADGLGYDCLSIPESFGRDGVSLFVTMPAATRAECEPLLAGIIPDRYR